MHNPFFNRRGINDATCFFGRGDLVRSLLQMVESGQSCAVVGERRIGKSSLLAFLADTRVLASHGLDPHQTFTVLMDFLVLHECSPQDVWIEILETLVHAIENEELREIVSKPLLKAEVSFTDFRRALRALNRRNIRVVLLCDEFELCVQNPQFDESFFGALRSLASGEGVAFVTASRLGLLELGQYHGEAARQKVLSSPFFNIFAEFVLGPFEDYEVAEMLVASLQQSQVLFHADDVAWLDRVGGRHPYFLQLAAYHIFTELESRGEALLDEDRVAVFDRVRDEAEKTFRSQWQHSGDQERSALAALAIAAASGEARRFPEKERDILVRLEQRGLVRSAKPDGVVDSGRARRSYRLFSVVFSKWLSTAVSVSASISAEGRAGVEAVAPSGQAPSTPRLQPVDQPSLLEDSGALSLERYAMLEEIGKGGTGTVYKAWDEKLERVVAIKVLNQQIRAEHQKLERLIREARTCASLYHPNIIVIYDIDIDQGLLVEEFLPGGSLRDLLEATPVLAFNDVLSLGEQMADGLAAAHGAGVIHRDLKPENILLTGRARRPGAENGGALPPVKLADFGTALRLGDPQQAAERRSTAGTLSYMAPEQLAGSDAGPASDIYALGVVLHEAGRGVHPDTGDTKIPQQSNGNERATAILNAIIARCLTPEPRQRFSSAENLLTALRRVERSGPPR